MNARFAGSITAITLFALASTADAAPKARPKPPTPLPDTVRVAMVTELGTITADLDVKHAPVTATNFVRYVDQQRLDGTTFYRVMRLAWGQQPNGLVQGGARYDPKRILKSIPHEPTNQTGLLHKAGALSMARLAPGTANADFSILLSDMPGLDANPAATDPEAKAGYAVFGYVVDGMDVVSKIYDVPLSATLGEGVLKGQMIAKPVRILRIRRIPIPAAAPLPAATTPAQPGAATPAPMAPTAPAGGPAPVAIPF